jgi:hypothetical protein
MTINTLRPLVGDDGVMAKPPNGTAAAAVV